jgi:hypothetical protein
MVISLTIISTRLIPHFSFIMRSSLSNYFRAIRLCRARAVIPNADTGTRLLPCETSLTASCFINSQSFIPETRRPGNGRELLTKLRLLLEPYIRNTRQLMQSTTVNKDSSPKVAFGNQERASVYVLLHNPTQRK